MGWTSGTPNLRHCFTAWYSRYMSSSTGKINKSSNCKHKISRQSSSPNQGSPHAASDWGHEHTVTRAQPLHCDKGRGCHYEHNDTVNATSQFYGHNKNNCIQNYFLTSYFDSSGGFVSTRETASTIWV